jgi:flagellar hook-associated protein 1 FlgK
VNQAHRLGYGLDGSTGNDFFNALPVSTDTRSANTGSATIGGGAITAASLLTFHDYEIHFSSATAYSIVDADTGATIKGNYTGTAIAAPTVDAPVSVVTGANDTLTVSVDGTASGTITLSGAASPGLSYTSGAALASEVQSKINADATLSAAGKSVTVIYDTTTNRLVITSNDTTSSSVVDVTGGTARATLGLSAGTSTAASGTYGTPQTFTLDGISVTISGTPAANDVFEVNSRDGAAASLTVAVTDRNKVAASSALTGIPFDNGVALQMSALKSKSLAALGSATLSQYYGATAATLGSTTQKAVRDFNVQTGLQEQLQAFRSEVSGVSLDEELVRMLQYQRAFEAAARLITLTDQMLEDLMTLKR